MLCSFLLREENRSQRERSHNNTSSRPGKQCFAQLSRRTSGIWKGKKVHSGKDAIFTCTFTFLGNNIICIKCLTNSVTVQRLFTLLEEKADYEKGNREAGHLL